MSTYSPSELLSKWTKRALRLEQARPAGPRYRLQHLFAFGQRLIEIEKRLRQLEQPPTKPQA